MAITLPGNGVPVASEVIGGEHYQYAKLTFGAVGTATPVSSAAPLPVLLGAGANAIGSVIVTDADTIVTGTITANDTVAGTPAGTGAFINGASLTTSFVAVQAQGGDSAWNVQITGLTSGTLYFEASLDSTNGRDGNWINVNGRRTGVVNTQLSGNATADGMYRGNTSGTKWFRVRSVGSLSGSPAIVIRISSGVGAIFLNASIPAGSNNIGMVDARPTTLWVPATGTSGAAVTATLPAAGAGLSHYITSLQISIYSTGASRAGGATPDTVTTTNLPGSPAWNFPTAQGMGTIDRLVVDLPFPLKSSAANTATTFVAPAAVGGIWRMNIGYFTAP